MKTLLSTKASQGRACIVRLTNASGETYVYGVFAGDEAAQEFIDKECRGFIATIERLMVVERR
jgi:hypothetical protein